MATKFSINGRPYVVNLNQLPADITLNTFIREHAGLSATKFMCQEGGCGVCVVTVTGKHPENHEIRTWAVNSCLTLLNTCTNLEITTSEGLGNKRDGYHPIQTRLSKMNGTQCGYCSPGFVMNMHGLLESKGGKVSMEEVENSFGGNICRCTGYRPILDAMKSFAYDSNIEIPAECRDIEDLNSANCPKTGNPCSGACHGVNNLTHLNYNDGSQWYWPKSLEELFENFQKIGNEKYILVAGNTAHGVYRRSTDIKIFIDINAIAELKRHQIIGSTLNRSDSTLILGGNLSLTETMNIFVEAAKVPGFEYCQQLWETFDLIANVPVRNCGTLAGNLSIKNQHIEFPSDVFIAFEALDVQVVINESPTKKTIVSLIDYLNMSMEKKLITNFILRSYSREKYLFGSYKIMPRAQNAHAYVNAAFLINIERPTFIVNNARICFGGISPEFIHATAVENFLIGRQLFEQKNLSQIFGTLEQYLLADHVLPDASPQYRRKLACGLLYKFILKNAPTSILSKRQLSGADILRRPISTGKQSFDTIPESYPVTLPTEKHEGILQTAGEATYANDLPVQPNQVWAAFVTAKKIGATVTSVDTSAALNLPGVVAYLSAQDIPGKNSVAGTETFFFKVPEELFATGPIKFYNQPIGIIVAESNALANHAVELVKLTYSGGASEILPTLNDVLQNGATKRITHNIKSLIEELKINESYDYTNTGNLDLGLQYHFYMEPQTTIAVPFEGRLTLHCATQWMDSIQRIVSDLLLAKNKDIQIKVRRLGGGYGGKASRCNLAACAAALAAYKLNRPVRFVQSLESMMNTLGKRWAFHLDYKFYVKNTGKIVAILANFFEDAGCLPNESPMDHVVMLSKNCYEFSDNYKVDGNIVETDSPSNTPCRAPGSVEGIAMIENIIEHVAFETGVDPLDVRMANLLPGHKMGEMLPTFIESTQYRARKATIAAFNKEHRWRKKGLGFAIMEYHIGYFGQYPATLAIYHGDGSVTISHGGIEMGQGMNTKLAQVAAHHLGIPMDLIRIEGSNTFNGVNSMVTGGAVGSELLCYAVRHCCNTINERLAPLKKELKDSSWQDLITAAYDRKILLIATEDCKANDMNPYTVCGLCLTETEVDVLTGNYLINRCEILEDTGESLNPNVDIGQIEGAFMMGLGYWTSEQIVVDKVTGELKTNRSWNYKPPGPKDIPVDLRIDLLPKAAHNAGFMRSKATGEPAICLSIAVAFALQEAIQSARDDAELEKKWITLNAPMTPEYVLLSCGTNIGTLSLE